MLTLGLKREEEEGLGLFSFASPGAIFSACLLNPGRRRIGEWGKECSAACVSLTSLGISLVDDSSLKL